MLDWIGYAVDNQWQEIINVVLAFVHEPSGYIADQDDGSKAVFTGSPVFSVGSGAVSGVVNTTVAYGGGNYTVVVVTDKGNVRSAVFPAKLITAKEVEGFAEQVEGVTTKAIGTLLMDYTTFQMCKSDDFGTTGDCGLTGSDWHKRMDCGL